MHNLIRARAKYVEPQQQQQLQQQQSSPTSTVAGDASGSVLDSQVLHICLMFLLVGVHGYACLTPL